MSLVLHELGHAYVADWNGDKTARYMGRLSFNPLKHLDVMGTILLFVVGFGWAKPVPIRPGNFRHYRQGLLLVSIAGVAANLLIAVLALLALNALGVGVNAAGSLTLTPQSVLNAPWGNNVITGLLIAVRINILLLVFNLLPIPPLDGSKVVQALAPEFVQQSLQQLERFGFLLVLAVIFLFDAQVFGLIDRITGFFMRLFL